MTLLDVLAHAMDRRERRLAVLASKRSLPGVLEEMSDQRVLVSKLDAADVARKLLLAFVDLKNVVTINYQQQSKSFKASYNAPMSFWNIVLH